MNIQPHTLSNTVSDEHVPSPLPALPSPVLSPSTKFGEGVSLLGLSCLASKSAHLANAIDYANSMNYPEGEFAVIEKSYARSKTHADTLHTTFIVSLKTCHAFHGKNPHKKMCDEMDIDLYSIQSETLVRQLQDAASHGLPPFWLLDNSDTGCHVTSPNGDVMGGITKAHEFCNVSQPVYLREAVVALKRMRQQKRTSFFNDWRDWSSASHASYQALGRLLRSEGQPNYEHLKDLIKYINSSVREDEYAGCADLAGLMFCLNKRLRVGNAVPDDALSTDVRLGSLNIGVIELDKVGRDGVIYHPLYSDQAEYESMDGGYDYSGLTEGTIVVAKINSLVDGNDDAIDESNEAFMLLRYLGCYVDDDDKLFVVLTVPATNEDGEDDEYYLIAGEDEDLEATVNHNLFIFTLPGTSLPFYDEEGDTVHVPAEEMTAKKKEKKKKAIPSTHSQPVQKKPRTQQRRKKKSRQPQWSDEEDCEEDYEDEEVVPRSTILRSAKKEEVDYKEKEEKDDDDDCESEDEGKEKDDEDAGHLESDCEWEDEGKEKEEKDDDYAGHLESDCESEDEDKTLKQNLILQLSMMNVRLAPSNIDGIGVFAAVDIPEGITLFSTCNQDISNQDTSDQTIPLSADEVDSLPSFPQKMVKNFLLPDDSGMRHIPATGLHGLLGQSMYMNSSYGLASRTNVAQDTSVDAVGSYGYTVFKTTKEVMEGEELLLSYKYPGCFKGKQGKFYYTNNNQGEQWMDGTIDEYFTKDERDAMAVKKGKDPTNKHKRGMYKFTLDFDGDVDYFSEEDDTVEIDGMTGAELWKEY
eukprot:scaffold4617_cov165-Skeletonema_marinoi.AAC.4